MTDSNFTAFRDKLIADDLIFGDETMSAMSKAMNQWRFQHLLDMAQVAAAANEKVMVNADFELGEMMAQLDTQLSLSKSSLFTLEDVFEALASHDPGHASPPSSDSADFSADDYLNTLQEIVAKNASARPWRAEQPPHAVTKTAFPGASPDIPLPPSLRK